MRDKLLARRDARDDETCDHERESYSRPDHVHICAAPAGHRYDDGHVCPCGDWWHD